MFDESMLNCFVNSYCKECIEDLDKEGYFELDAYMSGQCENCQSKEELLCFKQN